MISEVEIRRWIAGLIGLLTEQRRRGWVLSVFGAPLGWSFASELMRTTLSGTTRVGPTMIGHWAMGFYLWISAIGIGTVASLASGGLALRDRRGEAK